MHHDSKAREKFFRSFEIFIPNCWINWRISMLFLVLLHPEVHCQLCPFLWSMDWAISYLNTVLVRSNDQYKTLNVGHICRIIAHYYLLLLNYVLCYYSWCYSYLCLYLRCQSLFWINVISEQQVFLYHTVPSIATFSQQSAFWPRLPQLTEGSLLRTELLATSTCLSIPYIFIVDHKDAKDCPVRECVICNYVSHSILIRFVID